MAPARATTDATFRANGLARFDLQATFSRKQSYRLSAGSRLACPGVCPRQVQLRLLLESVFSVFRNFADVVGELSNPCVGLAELLLGAADETCDPLIGIAELLLCPDLRTGKRGESIIQTILVRGQNIESSYAPVQVLLNSGHSVFKIGHALP